MGEGGEVGEVGFVAWKREVAVGVANAVESAMVERVGKEAVVVEATEEGGRSGVQEAEAELEEGGAGATSRAAAMRAGERHSAEADEDEGGEARAACAVATGGREAKESGEGEREGGAAAAGVATLRRLKECAFGLCVCVAVCAEGDTGKEGGGDKGAEWCCRMARPFRAPRGVCAEEWRPWRGRGRPEGGGGEEKGLQGTRPCERERREGKGRKDAFEGNSGDKTQTRRWAVAAIGKTKVTEHTHTHTHIHTHTHREMEVR